MGLEYSEAGKLNKSILYSRYNDLNIFVEDKGKEYFYQIIFQRMFEGERFKLEKVFSLGGKEEVKKAYYKKGKLSNGIPNIYIVDGDFDVILNKKDIDCRRFIYLDRYNIENYLIQEESLIKFISLKKRIKLSDAYTLLQFEKWKSDIETYLFPLFIAYMVVQKVDSELENVGASCHPLVAERGLIDNIKVEAKINYYKSKIFNFNDEYKGIEVKVREHYTSILHIICGKYLECAMYHYLIKQCNLQLRQEELKIFLTEAFSIENLNFVKEVFVEALEYNDHN